MEVWTEDGYGVVGVTSCFEAFKGLHAIVEGRGETMDLEVWGGVYRWRGPLLRGDGEGCFHVRRDGLGGGGLSGDIEGEGGPVNGCQGSRRGCHGSACLWVYSPCW